MIGYTVGTYKITEKLGEGGMGAVYRGIDIMLEREVAIKALRPELARQPDLVERFRSEAKTLAKLNHPNIATVYNFLRQNDDFFMVMEFVQGETLDNVIKRFGAMPIERAVPLFCHALEGIEHAHRMGIIHRDIKPANMMMTAEGAIKVMDFGIARVLGTARMTKQGNIVGTIEYMSPEQVRGQETDARSDIYSMGVLLYEMLTGRVPFSSDSEYDLMKMQIEDAPTPPRTFAGQIPLPVEQAIMRALAKRPEARFQTAGELRTALISGAGIDAALLSAVPVIQPPAPVAPPQTSDIAKETRVASAASTAGDQLQATQPAYQQNVAPDYGYQYQAAQPQAGFLSRLNWKHYAGAVVVLAAVIAVPVVILSSAGQKKDVVQQPAANQPRPTTSTQAEPSRSASPPTGSGTASVPSGEQPGAVTDPMKPKSIGELPVLPLPGETATANKQAKPAARKDDAAARAKAEKERKAAEARRLLNQ